MTKSKSDIIYNKFFEGKETLFHPEELALDEIDFIKFQLGWFLRGTYSCRDTELVILAYIYLYGYKAIDKIVETKLLKSRKTIENCISKFRKDGIVVGFGKETSIHSKIKLKDVDFTFLIQVKKI